MLKLFNSLTRQKEIFKPIRKKKVSMYNCGPTVYNYIHLGNLRSFLLADLLRRYLEYQGCQVKQVMNITDVGHMINDAETGEDKLESTAENMLYVKCKNCGHETPTYLACKRGEAFKTLKLSNMATDCENCGEEIIYNKKDVFYKDSKKEQKTPQEIAQFYEKSFFQDIDSLNIQRACCYPRATEHIPEMIKMVKQLIKNGYAYEINGSVYFDVTKFKDYGKLSGNTLNQLQAGKRLEIHPDKKNPWDFALWIYDPQHIMHWPSPWNDHGYPGWHLECSAMSMKYLGKTFDIHTGGEDNKFPHHECEIAQSEGTTGKKWVNYWLHVKHLIVENEKMSKSLGNFYTLRDLLNKGYSSRAIRYLLLSTHYRQQLNFTFEGLSAAQSAVDKIDEFSSKIYAIALSHNKSTNHPELPPAPRLQRAGVSGSQIQNLIQQTEQKFTMAMDDDLNVSEALATIFDFIKEINKLNLDAQSAKKIEKFILKIDAVLGLNLNKINQQKIDIPEEIKKLVEQREQVRKNKDWTKADELRNKIENLGWLIKDTTDGSNVRKK